MRHIYRYFWAATKILFVTAVTAITGQFFIVFGEQQGWYQIPSRWAGSVIGFFTYLHHALWFPWVAASIVALFVGVRLETWRKAWEAQGDAEKEAHLERLIAEMLRLGLKLRDINEAWNQNRNPKLPPRAVVGELKCLFVELQRLGLTTPTFPKDTDAVNGGRDYLSAMRTLLQERYMAEAIRQSPEVSRKAVEEAIKWAVPGTDQGTLDD